MQVIVLLGEIDCREGLLLAVDKLKYDSVDEATHVLADIYLDVLTRLVEARALTVYVHPVPPVLNETRHIVMPFNAVMRAKVIPLFFSLPALLWLFCILIMCDPSPESKQCMRAISDFQLATATEPMRTVLALLEAQQLGCLSLEADARSLCVEPGSVVHDLTPSLFCRYWEVTRRDDCTGWMLLRSI